jgi:hypothetical protein
LVLLTVLVILVLFVAVVGQVTAQMLVGFPSVRLLVRVVALNVDRTVGLMPWRLGVVQPFMPLVVLIVLLTVVRPVVLVLVLLRPCLALRVLALFLVRLVASLRLVCLVRVDLFV